MARWQRERRQRAIILVVFTVLLVSAVGLMAWAAAQRYYSANLIPAATVDGRVLPYRLYNRERDYELIKFYQDYGVPQGQENDPQLAQQKGDYDRLALDSIVEHALFNAATLSDGYRVGPTEVQARYAADFAEYRTRHVLVQIDRNAKDKDAADKAARAKAQDIATQLKAAPNDANLWATLAKTSDDPGSKDKGGEIGWASKGQLVKEYEATAQKLAIGEVSDPVKTSFGYHVIQLEERRGPENNALVKRWLASGFRLDDVLVHERYDLLRDHYTELAQAQAATSPTEQIHLLHVIISTPTPSTAAAQDFTAALKKIGEFKDALNGGGDFAELAKKYSENSDEAKNGGDAGWFARGILDSVTKEDELFALAPGTVSRQFSTTTQVEFYKVTEKDPARALTDDQQQKLKDNAYAYWSDRQRKAHHVVRLVPGFEFQP